MVCVELGLIHGENNHGKAMELMGMGDRDGEDDGLCGGANHGLRDLYPQQLTVGKLREGDWAWGLPLLKEKEAWLRPPSIATTR